MMPQHHPGDELLLSYAAGSQDEPTALVVATHLALCPRCRREVSRYEELGGVLLDDQNTAELSDGSLGRILACLDDETHEEPAETTSRPMDADLVVPRPLRDYLGTNLDQLGWKSFRGLKKVELLPELPGVRTRLMRIKSGTAMPAHTHEGTELTLVLDGGFSDEHGHFLRGDFAEADPSINHRPIADPGDDCLCLAVTDAPLRLTGPVGRLLNPLLNI